jgi:O-antigen/teichoic acid export membrane protein
MSSGRPSLKTLVLRGSAIAIGSHGLGQVIRLAKSLILTRLLFPEAFGAMALVWAVMYGLNMLSDAGLGPAIVRDRRGEDPDFLNTAWTVQAIRGAMLWGVSCLIAAPMASFYHQPELAQLIPVAGVTALIAGFNSTALHTCRRRMEIGRVAILELCNEVVGLIALVAWALVSRSVWALVGGAVISSAFLAVASHAFLPGIRNRFRWERESLHVFAEYGKWIYLSSAIHFFSVQSDRLLMGRYLDMGQLGIYSIAVTLCEALEVVSTKINSSVLFPAYGTIAREEKERLRSVFHRGRLGVDAILVLPIGALMVLGDWVVALLYDARYHQAGWMFQVLCARALMVATLRNSEACLIALGHPRYTFIQSACRATCILAGIPLGWHLAGISGVVWAVALSEIPVAAALWIGLARHNMFSAMCELRSFLFAAAGAAIGLGLLQFVR